MENSTPSRSYFEVEKSRGEEIMHKNNNIKLWYYDNLRWNG